MAVFDVLKSIHFETALVVVMGAFWVSLVLAVGSWVFHDALARRSDQPLWWGFASMFVPFGLPYYLYKRSRSAGLAHRSEPPTRYERALATWASASLTAAVADAILAPPDPYTQIVFIPVSVVLVLPPAYLLVYRGEYRTLLNWANAS